ncbi:hypothetical protein [Sphingopyxis sp. 113P3]|uniref:hypothetical protein n=1 Tax=Sphingopyxis sp. (strain 113P3) TaxID=292913 RepID=UPI0006AD4A0A|nr:hypothetical protein [Sphingopyxis sp. 113P3]ALC13825.1 hypothetical protein LH20_17855 [Sphingopyxis sp. 113P3]
MCTPKAPDLPIQPERQAMKLPDEGLDLSKDSSKRRRAIMAGLITSPQGALGSPNTSQATLG